MDLYLVEYLKDGSEWKQVALTNDSRVARQVVREARGAGLLVVVSRFPSDQRISDSDCRKIAEFVRSSSPA